ncbi:MAG: glucose 1-dehydrogenase [Actinobacteria bacterium]|nr:glucose 1-dehydrogenase [Actinomycetota bacterium]MDA2995341.1 glucose 1-dehydrogenase [Actinomycetota bacterium]
MEAVMDNRFDLTGRVALVTGGSRGLGREMVLAFAEHGADVLIASRKIEACEELASEVRDRTGRRAVAAAFHAGRWEQADELAGLVYSEFGRCDVLVNNAGMSPLYPSLAEVSEELFDKVVGVNFKGPFRLASLIGTRMAAGDGGSIINVSSIAAVAPTPHELVYAGAKAALDAMTAGMARAFGPKVRCNVIMPGPFLTDISKAWDLEAFDARAKTEIPLQRGGEAHEIVGAALYLASDASSYTSGATIRIDGAMAYSAG